MSQKSNDENTLSLNSFWSVSNTIIETGRKLESFVHAQEALENERNQLREEIQKYQFALEQERVKHQDLAARLKLIQEQFGQEQKNHIITNEKLKQALKQILTLRNECQKIPLATAQIKKLSFSLADQQQKESELRRIVQLEIKKSEEISNELNQAQNTIQKFQVALKQASLQIEQQRQQMEQQQGLERQIKSEVEKREIAVLKKQDEIELIKNQKVQLTEALAREHQNQNSLRALVERLRNELTEAKQTHLDQEKVNHHTIERLHAENQALNVRLTQTVRQSAQLEIEAEQIRKTLDDQFKPSPYSFCETSNA